MSVRNEVIYGCSECNARLRKCHICPHCGGEPHIAHYPQDGTSNYQKRWGKVSVQKEIKQILDPYKVSFEHPDPNSDNMNCVVYFGDGIVAEFQVSFWYPYHPFNGVAIWKDISFNIMRLLKDYRALAQGQGRQHRLKPTTPEEPYVYSHPQNGC